MGDDFEADIVIHPRKGRHERVVPGQGFLVVNPSEASSCHLQLRKQGGVERFLFNSGLTVEAGGAYFIAGPAIGAPMAAMTMEKLVALGARRIVLFGWCGAIAHEYRIGDIVLPDRALSGEGTSSYYHLSEPAAPSSALRGDIARIFSQHGVKTVSGCVWSTDAVYRENRKMLHQLSKVNTVCAVDMEFSALCSVACFRGIEFAAVLVVSDELWGDAWKPGFSSAIFLEAKAKALEVLLAGMGPYGD